MITYSDVSSNNLPDLPTGLFRRNRNLEMAVIARNRISVLRGGLFVGLRNLTEVDATANNITEIQENSM